MENEYGAFGYDDGIRDTEYLKTVMSILQSSGFGSNVLYFTSDSPLATGALGAIPGGNLRPLLPSPSPPLPLIIKISLQC